MNIKIIYGFSSALLSLTLNACGGSSPDPNNPPEPITYDGNENQAIITKTNAAKLISLVSKSKDFGSSSPITPANAKGSKNKRPVTLDRIIQALSNSRILQLATDLDSYSAKSASTTATNTNCNPGYIASGDNGLFRFYGCNDGNGVVLDGSIRVVGNKQSYTVEYLGYTMSFIGSEPGYDAVVELGGSSAWHYNLPDAATQLDITLNTVIKNHDTGSVWLTKNYIYTETANDTAPNSPYRTTFIGDVYDWDLGFVSVTTAPPFKYSGVAGTYPSEGGLKITGAASTHAEFTALTGSTNDVEIFIKFGPEFADGCTFELTWEVFSAANYTCPPPPAP